MSLNDDDKEYFKLVIESSINAAMKPVMTEVAENKLITQRHEQSLYGAEGNNGLTGDMKTVKRKVEGVNLKIAWAMGAGTAIATIGATIFKKIIGG